MKERKNFQQCSQGSKIVLVRSYLRVSQAAGQVNILIFLLKIKFSPCMPINFVMQGKCLFSDISRPGSGRNTLVANLVAAEFSEIINFLTVYGLYWLSSITKKDKNLDKFYHLCQNESAGEKKGKTFHNSMVFQFFIR